MFVCNYFEIHYCVLWFQSFEIFVPGIYVLRIKVFCFAAMDDVFVNVESKDEFASEEEKNSDDLDDVEVQSSFDCIFSCAVV